MVDPVEKSRRYNCLSQRSRAGFQDQAACKTARARQYCATFIGFQTPEEGTGIPVDLKGFAEGLQRCPEPRRSPCQKGRLAAQFG
jgi:invasion protein IalB